MPRCICFINCDLSSDTGGRAAPPRAPWLSGKPLLLAGPPPVAGGGGGGGGGAPPPIGIGGGGGGGGGAIELGPLAEIGFGIGGRPGPLLLKKRNTYKLICRKSQNSHATGNA